jgi:hypothetical protein
VRSFERALALGDNPRQATARAGLAYVRYVMNETDAAAGDALAALELWSRHRSEFTPPRAAAVLLTAASTLSYVRTTERTHVPYFEACVALAAKHTEAIRPAERAGCLVGLATAYTVLDSRYVDAAPRLDEAIAIQRADPLATSSLASTLQMRGMVHRFLGDFAEDERAQREAYELLARMSGEGSMSALWQRAVWALSLLGVNRAADAEREAQRVLPAARKHLPDPRSYLLWTPLFTATAAACVSGRDECEALAREAIGTLGGTPAADPRLAAARGFLGLALVRSGRCAEGRPLVQQAIRSNTERRRIPPYAAMLRDAAACEPR